MSEIVANYVNLLIEYLDQLRADFNTKFIKYLQDYLYSFDLKINYIHILDKDEFESSITVWWYYLSRSYQRFN